MRITNVSLTAFRGISSTLDFPFDNAGKSLLVYGENGSAKSSLARALEYLLNPNEFPDQGILAQRNLFISTEPSIQVEFAGKKDGKKKIETVTWTDASGKPTPSWLLSSAARSAFLDHRKLLMLSDRTHGDLPRRFFRTTVEHLFGNLPAGTSSETVSSLWNKVQADAESYREAATGKGREAELGVADPVTHYKPIEDAVNMLNQVLDGYLVATEGAPPIVTEAERILQRFEGHGLSIDLQFDHLTFNRNDGSIGGGELNPTISYCQEPLGTSIGGVWVSNHPDVLNEARLTALALALFFAAVRLQDAIPYIAGTIDPEEPVRLLVLDDILIGLDYAHRIPVLEIIQEEFAKDRRYQVILLTHDRVWYDVCRLQLGDKEWKALELYARRGKGPKGSDFPEPKLPLKNLLDRARYFLDECHELPAAANYVRSAVEFALRSICKKKRVLIPFHSNPEKLAAEVFIDAIRNVKRQKGSVQHLIPLNTQAQLRALRSTVLNPLSHFNPTTVTEPEIRKAIKVAEKLQGISKRIKAEENCD